jgi:predicted DNA-binding transcriptional regulator AlpA
MADTLLRFKDLQARGIVNNWPTLKRWVDTRGFPPGMYFGPGTRVWRESEIEAWIDSRPSARKDVVTEAARRGEIPTIKIGKRILVPVVALERMLQGSD